MVSNDPRPEKGPGGLPTGGLRGVRAPDPFVEVLQEAEVPLGRVVSLVRATRRGAQRHGAERVTVGDHDRACQRGWIARRDQQTVDAVRR